MEFLNTQMKKYPDLAPRYESFKHLHKQKLWHQLTVELGDFVLDPTCSKDANLVSLYTDFVSTFEEKLNQVKLIQILSVVSRQYLKSATPPFKAGEVDEAINFLENVEKVKLERVEMLKEAERLGTSGGGSKFEQSLSKFGIDAIILLKMSIAELYLAHPNTDVYQKKCLEKLREVENKYILGLKGMGTGQVNNFEGVIGNEGSGSVELLSLSSFYRVKCEYYKLIGPAESFYISAIQYISFTNIQQLLDKEKQVNLAIDICLSALVSENIYNFGEILSPPIYTFLSILTTGEGSGEYQWLIELLNIFNQGDIDKFSQIYEVNEAKFNQYKILTSNLEILKQKIGIMCLLKIIFQKNEKKIIDLDEIAKQVKLESDMVEWLIMKAMAKKLIEGKIDGVNRTLTVKWLKPRVLTRGQLGLLDNKVEIWKQKVKQTYNFVNEETPELFQ